MSESDSAPTKVPPSAVVENDGDDNADVGDEGSDVGEDSSDSDDGAAPPDGDSDGSEAEKTKRHSKRDSSEKLRTTHLAPEGDDDSGDDSAPGGVTPQTSSASNGGADTDGTDGAVGLDAPSADAAQSTFSALSEASTFSAAIADPEPPAPKTATAPLISNVLSWLGLGPSAANTPVKAPVNSPAVWGLLAWIRRQGQPGAAAQSGPSAARTASLVPEVVVAGDDTYSVNEDKTLTVTTSKGVLANDTGTGLTATKLTDPAHGTVTLNSDGSYTYKAVANYSGTDSFTYTATDSAGETATATVNLTVNPVNDIPTPVADSFTATEDEPRTLTAADLVGNDTDADASDGDSLTVSEVRGAVNGTVVLNEDGTVTFTPKANFNGTSSFLYRVRDEAGALSSSYAKVTLTVTAVEDAPTAVDDNYTMSEDVAKKFTAYQLVGNDIDPDKTYGDTLSVASVGDATNGDVVLNTDGTVTFTPTANYFGPASFTYQVKDATGAISANTATVNLTIKPVNDVPKGVADSYTVSEDTPHTFSANNLVGNDTDPDIATGDSLSVASVAGAINGTAVLNEDGTVTFTPKANFNGTASFTYRAKDESGALGNTTKVTLTVAAVNDAPTAVNDSFTVTEDTTKKITAYQLTNNDTDPDKTYGDTLSVGAVGNATNGTVVLNADGTVSFTPTANYNGPASFTYQVKDSTGTLSANTATVSLNVVAVNDVPTAVNDSYTVTDGEHTFTAADLVGNDIDPDKPYGDTLSVASVGGASNGTVTLNGDGTVTFTPTANYSGPASFTYQVKDAKGALSANTATVSLTVASDNSAPTAVDDNFNVPEDAAHTFTPGDLLGNDTDPDVGDVLTVTSVGNATNGSVVLNGDGTITFTPTADYNGAASFTYDIEDSAGASSTANVNLTVTAVNDAPTAVGDSFSVPEDGSHTFTAAQLVGNDTDPDKVYGDTLSVASVGGASNGSVVLNADGTVTFTPTGNYNGPASFTYQVKDAAGVVSANTATVNLTVSAVNDAPTAVNDTYTVSEGSGRTFTAADLVGNDTDPDKPYGDTLSVASVGGATNGSVVLNADGTVTFTPTGNYNGPASFTYQVKDAAGVVSANTATVSLTVTPVNDAPTAVNDAFNVPEDAAHNFTAADLVGNDTDPDKPYGDTLSVASVGGATNGTVVLNADGTVTFTPTGNYNGPASFTYQVKDAAGVVSANTATVSLTVTPVNDAPTAVGDSFSVPEDASHTFTGAQLVGNDTDPDKVYGDTLSVASVGGATNGTVVLNADGTVTFTPTGNYNGPASFTYQVKDAAGVVSANTATVNLTVTPINDAPTAVGDSFTIGEDGANTFTAAQLVGNDTDPDKVYGDTLSVASVGGASNGTVVLNGDGTVTFTPTGNYNGPASFTYQVKDAAGVVSANTATVNLTVAAVNDAPTAVGDSFSVPEDASHTFTGAQLVGNDTDPDKVYGDTLSVASVGGATNGTVVLNGDGTVTFTPTGNYNGPASFTYQVKDAAGVVSANTATVNLTVTPVNDAPTAVGDSFTIGEDGANTFTAAQLVGNDTDPDKVYGDTLSVASVGGATNGTVTLNGDGTVTFTPTSNYNGPASFTYQVKDAAGTVSANTATVNLTVTAVNDVPSAVNDTYTVSGSTRTFTAAELVGNDTDPDKVYGDTLSVASVGGATNGTVVLNGDGTVTFTAATNYSGPASFTYQVKDSTGAVSANSATVSLTVAATNNSPVIQTVTSSAPNTSTGAITVTVTATDADTPPQDLGMSVTPPAGGTVSSVTPNGDGTFTFTYTPSVLSRINAGSTLNADFDTLTITVTDGTHATNLPAAIEIYSGTTVVGNAAVTVGAGPSSMVMSPDGSRLYVSNQAGNSVSVIDTATGGVATFGVGLAPTQLALSQDGSTLYVANSLVNVITKVDTATGIAVPFVLPVGALPQGLAVNSTTNRLYVSVPGANRIGVLNATTGALITTITVGSLPVGVAVSQDGSRVYVANRGTTGNGTVSTINAATNTVIATTTVGSLPQQLALSQDGTRLYVTNTGGGTVSVLNTSTITAGAHPTVATIAVGASPNGVTLSPDGKIAYVANGDNTVSLINTATNTKVTGTIIVPTGGLGTIAVSPDGNTIYVANSVGNNVRTISLTHIADPPPPLTNPNTGAVVEDFTGPAGSVPDPDVWTYNVGVAGSGALQFNTNSPDNASLDGNGNLVITARQQTITVPGVGTRNYTSAVLDTRDSLEFTYGTVEIVAKVPVDQGLHPTLYLVGTDIDTVGWPNAGEIDIFELASDAAHSGSAIHGVGAYTVSEQAPAFASDGEFHTYWVKWEPDKITTGVDDTTIAVFTPDSLPPGTPWTFNDRSMHVVLSLGVGGDTVGPPNGSTDFPAQLIVDSVSYTPLAEAL